MGPEVMIDEHVVKEQAHLDKKYWFYIVVILRLFLKELTLDFGQ